MDGVEPFKVTVTPEQQAALRERRAEVFAPMTRAVAKLNHVYVFGKSAEHPGIIDSTVMATHHMGRMLEQLRSLNESRVAELRAGNLAAAVAPPQA